LKKAAPLLEEALSIAKKALGEDHDVVGNRLNSLAGLYTQQVRLFSPISSMSATLFTFIGNLDSEQVQRGGASVRKSHRNMEKGARGRASSGWHCPEQPGPTAPVPGSIVLSFPLHNAASLRVV
jgi:hypothetical protein